MTKIKIGLIGEHDTDCEAVSEIIYRSKLGYNTKIKPWGAKGSGNLKKELVRRIITLSSEGCNVFIIVHDLDRNPQNGSLNDEKELQTTLENLISQFKNLEKYICIPIEELEAWFWSDPTVIQELGGQKAKAHPNPQSIVKPKEKLIKLSCDKKQRPRYNPNDNARLAKMLDLDICSQRCPSFRKLLEFLDKL